MLCWSCTFNVYLLAWTASSSFQGPGSYLHNKQLCVWDASVSFLLLYYVVMLLLWVRAPTYSMYLCTTYIVPCMYIAVFLPSSQKKKIGRRLLKFDPNGFFFNKSNPTTTGIVCSEIVSLTPIWICVFLPPPAFNYSNQTTVLLYIITYHHISGFPTHNLYGLNDIGYKFF